MGSIDELINPIVVAALRDALNAASPSLDLAALSGVAHAIDGKLRHRVDLVRDPLLSDIPGSFASADELVLDAMNAPQFAGWMIWPTSPWASNVDQERRPDRPRPRRVLGTKSPRRGPTPEQPISPVERPPHLRRDDHQRGRRARDSRGRLRHRLPACERIDRAQDLQTRIARHRPRTKRPGHQEPLVQRDDHPASLPRNAYPHGPGQRHSVSQRSLHAHGRGGSLGAGAGG